MHVSPDEVYFGGGLWMPEADGLLKIRERIAAKPAQWKKVVGDKAFVKRFGSIEGEQLSRPPRGFDPGHPYIADIKRKSFVAGVESNPRATQSASFVTEVADGFRALTPLMKFLCDSVGVRF